MPLPVGVGVVGEGAAGDVLGEGGGRLGQDGGQVGVLLDELGGPRRQAGHILPDQDLGVAARAGLSPRTAKFVRKYADLTTVLSDAATAFAEDVTSGAFPDEAHSYR